MDKISLVKEMCKGIDLNTEVKVSMLTQVKLKGGKKNPMVNSVFKLTSDMPVSFFGFGKQPSYEDFVKTQMIAEGKDPAEFTASATKWGEHVKGTPLMKHNDQLYLRIIAEGHGKTKYFLKDDKGVYNQISKDEIIGMDPPADPTKPADASQGGIAEKLQVRSVKLENVVQLEVTNGASKRVTSLQSTPPMLVMTA